jgi:hypothetical protein
MSFKDFLVRRLKAIRQRDGFGATGAKSVITRLGRADEVSLSCQAGEI